MEFAYSTNWHMLTPFLNQMGLTYLVLSSTKVQFITVNFVLKIDIFDI